MKHTDRLRERALALPVACLVLFSPPLLTILGRPVSVAGVPLSYVYIFGAWLVLILVGRALARRLMPAIRPGPQAAPGQTGRAAEAEREA